MKPDSNPYASPQGHDDRSITGGFGRDILVPTVTGIAVIVGWPILFAVIGGSVAVALNKFAPAYYPGVFPDAVRGGDAAGVGVGTGILQGLTLGFLVGAAVIAGLSWFKKLRPYSCVQALLIIAAFAIGFAAVGTLVGYGLGRFVPGYYRGVFSEGLRPDFNPLDVGIGLGCSEGLLFGAVVGTAVVIVLTWRRSRRIVVSP